jgi:hypothetical protein
VKDNLLRSFLVLLLVVCVPFQAALAASVGQDAAIEQCHDGHDDHDGHGKQPASHCGSCCASAAIASVIHLVAASPVHDAVRAVPSVLPFGDLPDGLDRPPRAL